MTPSPFTPEPDLTPEPKPLTPTRAEVLKNLLTDLGILPEDKPFRPAQHGDPCGAHLPPEHAAVVEDLNSLPFDVARAKAQNLAIAGLSILGLTEQSRQRKMVVSMLQDFIVRYTPYTPTAG